MTRILAKGMALMSSALFLSAVGCGILASPAANGTGGGSPVPVGHDQPLMAVLKAHQPMEEWFYTDSLIGGTLEGTATLVNGAAQFMLTDPTASGGLVDANGAPVTSATVVTGDDAVMCIFPLTFGSGVMGYRYEELDATGFVDYLNNARGAFSVDGYGDFDDAARTLTVSWIIVYGTEANGDVIANIGLMEYPEIDGSGNISFAVYDTTGNASTPIVAVTFGVSVADSAWIIETDWNDWITSETPSVTSTAVAGQDLVDALINANGEIAVVGEYQANNSFAATEIYVRHWLNSPEIDGGTVSSGSAVLNSDGEITFELESMFGNGTVAVVVPADALFSLQTGIDQNGVPIVVSNPTAQEMVDALNSDPTEVFVTGYFNDATNTNVWKELYVDVTAHPSTEDWGTVSSGSVVLNANGEITFELESTQSGETVAVVVAVGAQFRIQNGTDIDSAPTVQEMVDALSSDPTSVWVEGVLDSATNIIPTGNLFVDVTVYPPSDMGTVSSGSVVLNSNGEITFELESTRSGETVAVVVSADAVFFLLIGGLPVGTPTVQEMVDALNSDPSSVYVAAMPGSTTTNPFAAVNLSVIKE